MKICDSGAVKICLSIRTFSQKNRFLDHLLHSQRKHSWMLATIPFILMGCQRIDPDAGVIKIFPVQELKVETGKEVNWRFKSEKAGRSVKIIDVQFDRLPVGVTVEFKNDEFILSGTALPSIFSEGNIKVTAYDEEVCKQSIVDGLGFADKVLAKFGFKVKGNNPLCNYSIHKNSLLFAKSGSFRWFSEQYAETSLNGSSQNQPVDMNPDIKNILASIAETALKNPLTDATYAQNRGSEFSSQKSGIFLIPPREAPHQGLSYMDACYLYELDQCGVTGDCVWHSGGCASLSKNNLKQVGK